MTIGLVVTVATPIGDIRFRWVGMNREAGISRLWQYQYPSVDSCAAFAPEWVCVIFAALPLNERPRFPRARKCRSLLAVEGVLLQDVLSVRGAASLHIVQSASGWLDLGDREDIVLYTDVRTVSGGAKLTFETSCVALDAAFVALLPQFALSVGLRTDVVLASMAKIPPMRFVRWNLTGDGSPWDATLRIWVAVYGGA